MDAHVRTLVLPFEYAPTRIRMRGLLLRMRSNVIQVGNMTLREGEAMSEEAFLLLVCLLLSRRETPELLLSDESKQD